MVSREQCSEHIKKPDCQFNFDYLGLTIPNKFIVGYDIDWDESFRYLSTIYQWRAGTNEKDAC
jgi:hypoxanthine-guanine phosphoribosyltransferase